MTHEATGASSPSSRSACIVILSFFFEPRVRVAAFLRGAALGRDASKEAMGSSLSICEKIERENGGKEKEEGEGEGGVAHGSTAVIRRTRAVGVTLVGI